MKGFTGWKLDLLDQLSTDHRLSATDFRVAYRLLHYMDGATGDCFPAQQTIIADTGLGERAVRYALTSLCACGWLKIERTGSRRRGLAQNHYCFPGRDYRHADAGKEASTTGTPARDDRHPIAGAYNREHFERKNTLNRESAKRAPRAQPLPEDFRPDLRVAHAAGMEQAEAQRQAALFRDHHRAKGTLMRDWNAAWRNWIRRVPDFTRRPNGQDHRQRRPHIAEQAFEAARQAHEREQEGLFDDNAEDTTDGPAGYLPPGVRH
jgi:hypothetical protein